MKKKKHIFVTRGVPTLLFIFIKTSEEEGKLSLNGAICPGVTWLVTCLLLSLPGPTTATMRTDNQSKTQRTTFILHLNVYRINNELLLNFVRNNKYLRKCLHIVNYGCDYWGLTWGMKLSSIVLTF